MEKILIAYPSEVDCLPTELNQNYVDRFRKNIIQVIQPVQARILPLTLRRVYWHCILFCHFPRYRSVNILESPLLPGKRKAGKDQAR